MKNNFSSYGGATLVMLFSVLCMTVFAVLALSSARSQLRLSERYADSVTEYYAADSRAAAIVGTLADAGDDYPDAVARLRGDGLDISYDSYAGTVLGISDDSYAGTIPDISDDANVGDVKISFSCSMNDSLALDVELVRRDGNWIILKWTLRDVSEWEPVSDLNV